MKKTLIFISLLSLIGSCAEPVSSSWDKKASTRKNEQTALQHLHHDYWNEIELREKKISDCEEFFLPDFFPLYQNQKFIYKVIIPRDTIFFLSISTTATQNNSFVEYLNDETPGNKLMQDFGINSLPFITGKITADSSLQLKWENDFFKGNPLYLDACMNTGHAVIIREDKKEFWEIECSGNDSIIVSATKKTADLAVFNQQFNNDNEEILKANMQAALDSVAAVTIAAMETSAENTSDILKLRIWDKSKTGKPQAFTLWFQRGTGLVKLLEESRGITLELVEY